jgi:hypothetical protein
MDRRSRLPVTAAKWLLRPLPWARAKDSYTIFVAAAAIASPRS